jgi:hypothetical protein
MFLAKVAIAEAAVADNALGSVFTVLEVAAWLAWRHVDDRMWKVARRVRRWVGR